MVSNHCSDPTTMTTLTVAPGKQAGGIDDIKPLIDLCKAGRLFEVQAWIASGKPVNMPPPGPKGQRVRSPLETAIDLGFHSLVEVLLMGGVTFVHHGWGCPMSRVLQMRRFDFV